MAKKEWTQVGTIRQAESGKLYIKFHGQNDKNGNFSTKCLSVLAEALEKAGKKGLALQIEKPQDKIYRLNELGYIDDDQVEARIDAIPDYIRYEVTLAPQDD